MTSVLPTGSPDSLAPAGVGTHRVPETGAPPGRTHRVPALLAAVTLPLGAALMGVSTFFDPPSREPEPRGMFVAYGADRAGADIAATILHYGMLLFGVGLLVAALAMATRRGRAVALVGGVLSAIGFANMSGMVLSDWYDAYLASAFGPDKAMEISNAASDMPALSAGWVIPAFVGCALGPIVVALGLAYGRAVSWWALAFPAAVVGLMVAGDALGSWAFQAMLVVATAYGVVLGVQLLGRAEREAA